jgi:hypothetical protein
VELPNQLTAVAPAARCALTPPGRHEPPHQCRGCYSAACGPAAERWAVGRQSTMRDTERQISPVVGHIRDLDSQQRRLAKRIAFWFLFAYLELYIFEAAAQDLLAAIGLAAFGVFVILRSTELGRRPHFTVLNGAIVGTLFWSGWRQNSSAIAIDAAILGTLVGLELIHRSSLFLLLVAFEHGCAVFFSPWSRLADMKHSPEIAAHVSARVLAIILAVAVAFHAHSRRQDPDRIIIEPQEPPRRRPLTAAEWDAKQKEK